jgi:hypothetical protein
MPNQISDRTQPIEDYSARTGILAARAETLAADLYALRRGVIAGGDEGVRRTSFRCDAATCSVRQAAADLRNTAADLDHVAASVGHGCPEHGDSLISSCGRTWCCDAACERTWDCDRVDLPCSEPVRRKLIDQPGDAVPVRHGHAVAACARPESTQVVPLAVEWREAQA